MRNRTNVTENPFQAGLFRLQRILAAALALGHAFDLRANPQGVSIANGNATFSVNGSQLTITASHNTVLNWQSFNIAPGETTTFNQPSAASVVWNRINDSNPSQIWGHLNANGIVVLMNQSGFFFGPGSVVNAAGFVATTCTTLPEFGSGAAWQFNGPPPLASIVNYGEIKVASGGSAFLIAEKIENHGTMIAPDGTLGLYAGKDVLVSERPDGRGLSAEVSLPAGSVDNTGKLVADAGSIFLHAKTVNQNGIVQANSVQERNGVIELVASDAVNLGANSALSANGDSGASGDGGQITVKSENTFSDAVGSTVSIQSGTLGGNGGQVEISAPFMDAIHSTIDGHANANGIGGSLLIDPLNITLGFSGSGAAGDATVPPATGTLALNVNSAFVGMSQIKLQAANNITLQSGTIWDLATSTGISTPGSLLTLEAGNDIIIQNTAGILAGPGWSVSLMAGRDFTAPNTYKPDLGNITLQGTGFIEAKDGSLSLKSGNNVTVGSGAVRTMGGGGIDVTAIGGSVNTGTKANGYYQFQNDSVTPYAVDPNLGGISTGAGGDVKITAGLDILSYLPVGSQISTFEGGSGAYGAAPGDVTLIAGRDVAGHFVVRNGTGTIQAGRDAGQYGANQTTVARQLALSLVSGGWNVNATHDILLQEVRNPNGIFNSLAGSYAAKHLFDYAPDAFVKLTGGNSVQLLGQVLPRKSTDQSITPIYAPLLDINAGAGGVSIGSANGGRFSSDVRLFPSALGQLDITTTAGGSLIGQGALNGVSRLIMSDSANTQLSLANLFDDHAPVPLHLNDPEPVRLTISGDVRNVQLVSPKRAELNIGGSLINGRLDVQNLHPDDVTQLNVAGDIRNDSEFTSVPVTKAPDFGAFLFAYIDSLPASVRLEGLDALMNKFSYNAQTGLLTFQNRMSDDELAVLKQLQVYVLDPDGNPQVDANNQPITKSVSILDAATAQAIYNASQNAAEHSNTGYFVSGPGSFDLTAHDVDLGATEGIQSVGPLRNPFLAALGDSGASINLNLSGNLEMFSTRISSASGGDININAAGTVNVGSSTFNGNDSHTRGIFTVAQSDVNVIAAGDINVNGSRIGAFDGGNVHVLSLHGNVDAGKGAGGSAEVEKVIVNSATGQIQTDIENIPYSGIFAVSWPKSLNAAFPDSVNAPGNISVETPEGNIVANGGGILQLSLNHVKSTTARITLTAGTEDTDGNVIFKGNIDAGGSGIIGNNVNLKATDGIKGLVVAQHDIDIASQQSVNVTAIGGGNVGVSSGGTVSGTIVGVGSVSASGGSIDASLLSQNVSASGATSGQVGFGQANAAGATSQGATAAADEETKKALASNNDEDDDKKKKTGDSPALVRRVGRVTVILPKKS